MWRERHQNDSLADGYQRLDVRAVGPVVGRRAGVGVVLVVLVAFGHRQPEFGEVPARQHVGDAHRWDIMTIWRSWRKERCSARTAAVGSRRKRRWSPSTPASQRTPPMLGPAATEGKGFRNASETLQDPSPSTRPSSLSLSPAPCFSCPPPLPSSLFYCTARFFVCDRPQIGAASPRRRLPPAVPPSGRLRAAADHKSLAAESQKNGKKGKKGKKKD